MCKHVDQALHSRSSITTVSKVEFFMLSIGNIRLLRSPVKKKHGQKGTCFLLFAGKMHYFTKLLFY